MRTHSLTLVLLTATAILQVPLPLPLLGQEDSVADGRRVMVQVTRSYARTMDLGWPEGRKAGSVSSAGDSMILATGSTTVAIPRDQIERLWVSDRPSRRSTTAAKGAGIGFVTGAAFGFLIGEDCSEEDFLCFSRGEMALAGGVAGAGAGLLVGLAIGGERWRELPGFRRRLSVAPNARGVALRLTLPI